MDELASVIQSQATAQAQERTPTVPPLGLADSATVRTRENAATKYGETVNGEMVEEGNRLVGQQCATSNAQDR